MFVFLCKIIRIKYSFRFYSIFCFTVLHHRRFKYYFRKIIRYLCFRIFPLEQSRAPLHIHGFYLISKFKKASHYLSVLFYKAGKKRLEIKFQTHTKKILSKSRITVILKKIFIFQILIMQNDILNPYIGRSFYENKS